MAQDLLSDEWTVNPDGAIGLAGWLVTAYTLGAVIGAPVIASLTGRLPRKWLILGLIGVFVISSLLVAVLPSFTLVVSARFLSGIPHGVYLGTMILVAASLMPPGKRGRGIAIVSSGPTLAVLIGAPLGTSIGQLLGWRAVFLLVAAIFGLAFIAITVALPFSPGNPAAGIRQELLALRLPQVWLTVLYGCLGFGAMFAITTYIAPISTTVSGISPTTVPAVLFALGVGMTFGNLASGWLADRTVSGNLLGFVVGMAFSTLGFALFAPSPIGLFIFTALLGFFNMGCSTAAQIRMIDVSRGSQALGASLNHSALNFGNAVGAFLGGLVIAAGFGYLAPSFVGFALAILGVSVVIASLIIERKSKPSLGFQGARGSKLNR
jgi:DHA1 family inner membrane transport protein